MKNIQSNAKKLNWVNALFLSITPLVGIIGTATLAIQNKISWPTIVLTFVFIVISGLSITCGYHRLFSHCAYQAHRSVRFLFALFGAGAFEGSVLEWCSDHRDHHRYTDTDEDPYNAKRGFWYSHLGWLLYLEPGKRTFENVTELSADPMLRLQHRFYVPIAIFTGFILPMMIGSLWGEADRKSVV